MSTVGDLTPENTIEGASDGTLIGNVGDALKVASSDDFQVEFHDEHLDNFHRLRVSDQVPIFDFSFRFGKRANYFDESTATGGTVTHSTISKGIKLSTTSSSGSKAIVQSYMNMKYNEGKSQLIFITGLFGTPYANTRRRVGLFNDNNGIFMEMAGLTMNVVVRSNSTGSVTELRIPSTSWNIDKMDGTGASGQIADPTKVQTFVLDFSNSMIRFGILVDNYILYVHAHYCSNAVTSPCLATTTLPLRFEIENTAASTASDLYIFTGSVSSEGGDRTTGSIKVIDTGTTAVSISTTAKVVAGVRLNSTAVALGAIIKPVEFSLTPYSGSAMCYYQLVLRPTLTGTETWSAFSDVADVLTSNPTYTDGTGIVLDSGFFSLGNNGSNKLSGQSGGGSLGNDKYLGASIAGVADKLVLVVRTYTSGTGSISFTGKWEEST